MELHEIKKSLFGFKKDSVFEYIAELNRACADKTEEVRREKAAALAELSRTNTELNDRLVSLELERDALKKQLAERERTLDGLRCENEQLKSDTDTRQTVEKEVAEILTEARSFAQTIREKTVREDEAVRLENRKARDAEARRLAEYRQSVSDVKALLDSVLNAAKGGLAQVEAEIAALEECAEDANADEDLT